MSWGGRIATWNIQGLQSKFPQLIEWMKKVSVDYTVVTETWMDFRAGGITRPWESDKCLLSLVNIEKDASIAGRPHGGVGLVCSERLAKNPVSIIDQDVKGHWAVWSLEKVWIVGVYFPPSMSLEAFEGNLEEISNTISSAPLNMPIFITGDFNASLKRVSGRFFDDNRGEIIRAWLGANGLMLKEPDLEHHYQTTICANDQVNGWRDLFILNQAAWNNARGLITQNTAEINSDHKPVLLEWEKPTVFKPREENILLPKRWKVFGLHDESLNSKYVSLVEKKTVILLFNLQEELREDLPTGRQALIDGYFDCINSVYDDVSDEVLGGSKQPIAGVSRKFKSEKVLGLQEDRKRALASYAAREGRDEFEEVKRINKELAEAKKLERQEHWKNSFVHEMETIQIGEYLQTLKRIRKGREKGITPRMTVETLEAIAIQFAKQLQPCYLQEGIRNPQLRSPNEDYEEVEPEDPFMANITEEERTLFSPRHVYRLFCESSYGKAPGESGLGLGLVKKKCPSF